MARVEAERPDPFLRARLRVDRQYRLELTAARAYGKSHSVFTGRALQSGEPEFLPEDTDGALALEEEESDTCPQCGMPKIWCSDPANQFAFDAEERVCWPTYRRELRLGHMRSEGRDEATFRATMVSARFREGHEPKIEAGLNLPANEGDEPEDGG